MIHKLSDILVVADMDGTLLSKKKELLPANLETIRLFTSLGGRFSIASGRVVESIARYKEVLNYLSPCIASGGCVIFDFQTMRPISTAVVPRASGQKAVNDITNMFSDLGVLISGTDGNNYQINGSRELNTLLSDERITYFLHPQEAVPIDWNKVLFAGPSDVLEEVEQYVTENAYLGVYFVRTAPQYFEMMPTGASKGSALHHLCGLLGVEIENTVAIGDYYNDIDMMKAAGHSVSMENAPQKIRDIADEVTGDCENCGVGQYLYSLVKKYGSL